MSKYFLYLWIIIFLTACQTSLPIISEMEAADDRSCQEKIEQIKSSEIDYLLHANRMIDAMINDQAVVNELGTNRLKLIIQAINHKSDIATSKIENINTAIKNRIIRSGKFIVVNSEQLSQVRFSSVFEKRQRKSTHCDESYEQLIMQLDNTQTDQLIWMEKKQFQ